MDFKLGLIGKGLLSFAGISLLLVSFKLLFYLNVGKDVFFLSLFLAAVVMVTLTDKEKRLSLSTLINVLIFLLIIFGSIKASEAIYDFSFDGQGYHQEALMYLDEGWNPIYEQTELGPQRDLWVTHYAKGVWFMGYSIYKVTEKLETGKAINLILFTGTLFMLIEFLRSYRINWLRTILLSTTAVSSPIVLNQVFTNYNDFHIHLLIINLIIGYITYFKRQEQSALLILFFSMIILINIKFTALGYAVIFTGFPILMVLYKKYIIKESVQIKNLIITLVLSMVLAIGVVGASSYIKNTLTNGHPFYPLAGEGKVDIMTSNMPVDLHDKNRLEKLFISTFAATSNSIDGPIEIKTPFTFSVEELEYARNPDTRVGGFGPLFGGIIILLLFVCITYSKNILKSSGLPMLIMLLIVLTLSIFINPETWWARYIPQLWIVPVIFMVYVYANAKRRLLVDILLFFFDANFCDTAD